MALNAISFLVKVSIQYFACAFQDFGKMPFHFAIENTLRNHIITWFVAAFTY